MKFSELHLNGNVLEALDAMRFEECTPIQEKSIPVILEGRDLIAVAQTGTGKTAAYLLPILNKLSEGGHPADAINCIVMAPTRELAQQIDQQMEGFSYFMSVSSVAVYGGNDGILFETGCWIWDFMTILCKLSNSFLKSGRQSCSLPPCLLRYNSWLVTF